LKKVYASYHESLLTITPEALEQIANNKEKSNMNNPIEAKIMTHR